MAAEHTARERRLAIIQKRDRERGREQVCAFLARNVRFIGSVDDELLNLRDKLVDRGGLTYTSMNGARALAERLVNGLRRWNGADVYMLLDSFQEAGLFALDDFGSEIIEKACLGDPEGFVICSREPILLVEVDRVGQDEPALFDLTFATSAGL